ncbi:AMP-binding enzyme [Azomonas agilis]|uniref:AMP-binding enzyme n=1 Tax=Azomonas agilis TaxID=116849 RepID=A0A562IY48_9GAMM|nr:AMP-binding protein [Azomonas agilis]TWH75848.1 AMP-binding enzyme [Azomonas agilis]
MSLSERPLPKAKIQLEDTLKLLERWATEKPAQIALCHKRRDRWKAWSWVDVQREVKRLEILLQRQGFGFGSRLAFSGALEPTLILLALAARSAGGDVVCISRHIQGQALHQELLHVQPSHGFVQSREGISQWLEAAHDLPYELPIFSVQSVARQQGRCQILPLTTQDAVAAQAKALPWSVVQHQHLLWAEEGTEWPEGLALVLHQGLHEGIGFAFPENTESASRDRCDIRPVGVVISEQRQRVLSAEIEQRLAPKGSWSRRLSDWALENAHIRPARWIATRLFRLLGLQRLKFILPSDQPTSLAPVRWMVQEQAA